MNGPDKIFATNALAHLHHENNKAITYTLIMKLYILVFALSNQKLSSLLRQKKTFLLTQLCNY